MILIKIYITGGRKMADRIVYSIPEMREAANNFRGKAEIREES